jgi:uncharacterized protein
MFAASGGCPVAEYPMQTEVQALTALFKVEFEDHATRALLELRQPVKPGEYSLTPELLEEWLRTEHGLTEVRQEVLTTVVNRVNRIGMPFDAVTVADHGRLPVHGEDGRLEWTVESAGDAMEALDGDTGRVDFFAMADFRAVQAGEVFAHIVPPGTGEDGVNVRGEPIRARKGKAIELEAGDRVELTEDGRFRAASDGRAEVACGRISVNRVLDIEQNVDFSTGNIRFAGSVNVPGCVRERFRVEAEEGVSVLGLVEGAFIESGGTVLLKGGINGRDSGLVEAAGDVVAKFVTNAEIRARGEVKVTNEIISSRVHGKQVLVPSGAIAGGEVTALDYLEAGEAGNDHGVRTVLAVNHDLYRELEAKAALERAEKIEAALTAMRENLSAMEPLLESMSETNAEAYFKFKQRAELLEAEAAEQREKHKELSKPEKRRDGVIIIRGGIQPGVILRIGRYEKVVMQEYPGRRVVVFDEDKYEIAISA